MMKKNLLLFLLFILSIHAYADSNYLGNKFWHTDEYGSVCISEDKIELDDKVEKGRLYHKNGFDVFAGDSHKYIILEATLLKTQFLYLIKADDNSKFAYGDWEMTFLKPGANCPYTAAKLVPFTVSKAESFITEKDKAGKEIRYLPENLNLFSLISNPWAVTKDSNKIIYINTERWRNPKTKYIPVDDIVIVNGFVFTEKDYLYEQNSRAKTIKISYSDISFETQLQDTGNFQVVHLPKSIDPTADNNIKIEIIDFYPGTKYSDVVISGIYYMDASWK